MKKLLAVILTVATLCTSLFGINVSAAPVNDAGIQIKNGGYDADTGIITFNVQMKLPASSGGVTAIATILSYNDAKLTLQGSAGDITATSTVKKDDKTPVNIVLTDDDEPADKYVIQDGDVVIVDANATSGYTSIGVSMMPNILNADTVPPTVDNPNSSQNTTSWQTVYSLNFKVKSGEEATAADIRFASKAVGTDDTANITALSAVNYDTNWAAYFHTVNSTTSSNMYHHTSLGEIVESTVQTMNATGNGGTDMDEAPPRKLGDVNNSGTANATDAFLIVRAVANNTPLTGLDLAAGDVNKSGTANATDAFLIVRAVANGTDLGYVE